MRSQQDRATGDLARSFLFPCACGLSKTAPPAESARSIPDFPRQRGHEKSSIHAVQETQVDGLAKLVESIRETGWTVWPGFLEEDLAENLSRESLSAWEEGEFRRAGVGRGANLAIREDVRTDHVMWLRDETMTPCQRSYLDTLEEIRVALNRGLFLGLADFEGHFAVYPPGAFYKPHLDRHQQTQDRVVTAILYLNPAWQPGDGGELKIWTTPGMKEGDSITVEPRMGTLVCFLAGDFWHEVLPAKKTRASVTGWFRGNPMI